MSSFAVELITTSKLCPGRIFITERFLSVKEVVVRKTLEVVATALVLIVTRVLEVGSLPLSIVLRLVISDVFVMVNSLVWTWGEVTF